MARTNTDSNATTAATRQIWERARQTAQDAKPIASDTKDAASRGLSMARAWAGPRVERTEQALQETVVPAAGRGVLRARAWAAPRVDRTGQVLQDTVAPKVAAALHSSALRLEPDKPKHNGWRVAAGVSLLLAVAAAVVAGLRIRNRRAEPAAATAADEAEPVSPAEQAKADAARTS